MDPLLDVRSIDVFYRRSQVLHGLSFSVGRGEIVCLLGNNGAGKTTTLRAITGLQPVASGSIHFCQNRLDGRSPPEIVKAGVALSPEGRRVFPHMTVLENLLIGGHLIRSRRRNQENVKVVFSLFPRLQERQKQRAGALSGGEQQMLAIGRALMAEPQLLLLDEPSLGVAPIIVSEIVSAITSIVKANGIGCVVVEQNAAMALGLSERGYVLEHGAIALAGRREELLKDNALQKAYLGVN